MKTTTIALAVLLMLLQVASNPVEFSAGTDDQQMAAMIRNATFMERSPEFTDLYLIQTPDKGRRIVIYCNSTYCYRQRSQAMTA